MTLEELFNMKAFVPKNGGGKVEVTPEFVVKVQPDRPGDHMHVIVHALGHDSETLDFLVDGDDIVALDDYNLAMSGNNGE